MTRWLKVSLREAPATVPSLAALVLFLVWATSQAGYPLTHWAPGGLLVLALLCIALLAVPVRLAEIPVPVRLALGCLAAYTALSFLSILWAEVPGDAWEGANRTLLYLLVFTLFAVWPGSSASAALLVCLWTLAMVALAVYVALRLDTASGAGFSALFVEERLVYPAGYPNATAAQWLMAFWPALLLARAERVPWGLRGLMAGGAVALADVALLSQSRGSLYATGAMVVLVFALIPQRLRTFATALPVALAIGLTAPLILRVGDRIQHGQSPHAAVHLAVAAMLLAALLTGLAVAAAAAVESRAALSPALARRMRRGVATVALATLLAVLAAGLAVAGNGVGGNPITRVRHTWESFESGYSKTTAGNRLVSGLGSNRYDFYRVALDAFTAHPLLGIGADNFRRQYLQQGRSTETPRYPHSVELRTLSQTGALGALLAVLGLGAALVAGARSVRRADPLGRGVAAAALSGFAYWAVHGSFDWFWEFAGLGAPAFALLGIACALSPVRGSGARRAARGGAGGSRGGCPARADREGAGDAPRGQRAGDVPHKQSVCATPRGGPPHARVGRLGRLLVTSLAGLLVLAAAASLAAPWLSERQIQSAARIWPKAPLAAYSRLDDAAKLDPLSDTAYLVAGSIALRFGNLARAQHEFSLALGRVPDDAYATLELGAIASESGERQRALALLQRALRANPRDRIAREALDAVRAGRRVSVAQLNRLILLKARRLG